MPGRSVIEEWCFAVAAQTNIEPMDGALPLCHQPRTQRRFNGVEHRVLRELEEHHGLELAHQPRVEQQEIDVRRAAFRRTWFYCFKKKNTIGIGRGTAPAEELRVVEAARGVCLPDLEDQVVERFAVELRDASGDLDYFADGLSAVENSQVIGA